MDMKEKIALVAEILDVEEENLAPETMLSDFEEWDSIAALTLISTLDEKFGRIISGKEVKGLKKVKDIIDYMQ